MIKTIITIMLTISFPNFMNKEMILPDKVAEIKPREVILKKKPRLNQEK